MDLRTHRRIHTILLILYWPALFVLTHIPIPRRVLEADVSDKSLHLAVFMVLAYLFWCTMHPKQRVLWHRRHAWICLGILWAFALIDEGTQQFVSGRFPDLWDLLADGFGAAMGLAILSVLPYWPATLVTYAAFWFMVMFCTTKDLGDILRINDGVLHGLFFIPFALIWLVSPFGPLGRARQ